MESIAAIREKFQKAAFKDYPALIRFYKEDRRAGVQKLAEQYGRKHCAMEAELLRLEKMHFFEKQHQTLPHVCGIDEAGRGPLAGPVVAAAVILPKEDGILYLNDSKQVPEKKREALYAEITQKALGIGVGIISQEQIDAVNILQATYEAMLQAVGNLPVEPDLLLVDALTLPRTKIPQIPIVKGDQKSVSIAAASIIAKVTRDRMMVEYGKAYPGYGFETHKGYGTRAHMDCIRRLGPCPLHRETFLKKPREKGQI